MSRPRKPINEISEFAFYYRKYREAKKNGTQLRKRGRPKKGENSIRNDAIKEYWAKRAEIVKNKYIGVKNND